MEVSDPLLAVLPAEEHGAAVQLAAEVHQAVRRLHLHAELGDLVQDVAQLVDDAHRARLQPLDGLGSRRIHRHVGAVDAATGLLQLLLDAHQLVAQLARASEFLVQRDQERVRLAQGEEAGGQRYVHRRTLQNAHAIGKRAAAQTRP